KYIVGGSFEGNGGCTINETGSVNFDITGRIVLEEDGGIYTLGQENTNTAVVNNTNSEGTVTLNIFNITEDSSIPAIVKDSTNKGNGTDARTLIVKLDDTSKHLIDVIDSDDDTIIYVNGVLYKGLLDEATLDVPAAITKGDALPTTLGGVSGFVWSGGNTNVAGQQTFTLTAPEGYFFDGFVKTKTFTVTVNDGVVAVTGVTLDKSSVTLMEGETTELKATITPANATNRTVIWSSDAQNVATVNGGVVKALSAGTAKITATTTDGSFTDICVVTVKALPEITAVDTSGLVMQTAWPYLGSIADKNNRWSSKYSEVENPTFYATIPATLEGEEIDLPVTWVSEDYKSDEIGTYTFKAVPSGSYSSYKFASGVIPAITVTVLDGGIGAVGARYGYVDGKAYGIALVVKGVDGGANQIYDATGCNKLYRTSESATADSSSLSSALVMVAGKRYEHTGGAGKQLYNGVTQGTINLTVTDGANISSIIGTNDGLDHNGDNNIYISNATVGTVYSGGRSYDERTANVTGNAYIDVSGLVNITTITGSGAIASTVRTGSVNVYIHDLDSASSIGTITRGTAPELIVKFDDTSKHLINKVKFDENTKVFVNDIEIEIITYLDLSKTEYSVFEGTKKEDIGLPTSFVIDGVTVDGFTWAGDYNANAVGTYTLKLVPPTDMHLALDIYVTVTVLKDAVYKIQSVLTPAGTQSVAYDTAVENVITLLPTEFEAELIDGTKKTVTNSSFKWVSEDYSSKVPGQYTFETVITDDDYTFLEDVTPYTVKVTVGNPAGAGTVLTEIKVPVNYTVLTPATGTLAIRAQNGTTTNQNVGIKFYDELDVVLFKDGVRTETKITDIKWQGNVLKTDGNGTYYTYKITSFEQQDDITVPQEIIESATITVYKLNSGAYTHSSNYARSTAGMVIPVTVSLSGHEAYSSGWLGYEGVVINDATGCNNVNSNVGYSTNVIYHGGATTDVEGNPSVTIGKGATVNAVFGGGFKAKVTGDATITLKEDSTVNNNVYAGSFWNDYVGSTTINVESGARVKGKILACGDDGKFRGDVIINIADGAKIGGISLGEVEANYPDSVSIYVSSSFDISLIEGRDTGRIKLYIDGAMTYDVTEVDVPEVAVYNVALGTSAAEIGLPTSIPATVNGVASSIENVAWVCENYNANVAGKYTFTPVIPENYNLNCDTAHVVITVRVLSANAGQSVITGFDPIDEITVSYGTSEHQIAFPETVTATVNGSSKSVEVDKWTCTDYDGFVHGAQYVFTAVVSAEYKLQGVSAPTVVVKIGEARVVEIYVPVTSTVFPRNSVSKPVFYDTLSVKLDNGEVMEVSGFKWTVAGYNKNQVGTFVAKITSVPENCIFDPSLKLPEITIEISRYKYQIDSYVYLNSIPTVINGDDSGTYLYDLTGCNKTNSKNVAAISIYGGGPEGCPSYKTTYIELRGGKVTSLIGGSARASKITDTTYVYAFGGTVSNIFSGGHGVNSDAGIAIVQNCYTYVEGAQVTAKICGSGYHSKVLGDVTVVVKNASVESLMSGSYSSGRRGLVEGKATIKLLDGAIVNRVLGTGRMSTVYETEIYISNKAAIKSVLLPTGNSASVNGVKIFYEKGFDLSNVYVEEDNVKLYEGHFEEDRETFVTDREMKVVRNAGLIRTDYYVDYGTTLENIGLPTSFTGDVNGEPATVEGISYTPINGYKANVPGRYDFKLNVPDGYVLPITTREKAEKITVVVSESNQGGNITEILAGNTGYTLANGTAIENVGLPVTYNVKISGVTKTIPVKNWNITDENGRSVTFDRYTAGTYVFTPDFGSAYTVDSNAVVPTHTVKISALRPYTNIFTNNTFAVSLVGIPSEHKAANGAQYAYDKAGNFLAMTSTGSHLYTGAVSYSYEASWSSKDYDAYVLESTDFTMKSGTLNGLFAGSRDNAIGKTRTVIDGGTITTLYGGNRNALQDGTEIIINGGTITTVYSGYGETNNGQVYIEVNGGTITNLATGSGYAGTIYGAPQAEDEVLALRSEKYDEPIVVKKGETISAVFVQNGGTINNLYVGYAAKTTNMGSVKVYLNGGTTTMINGAGNSPTASTQGNVYISVSDNVTCSNIIANTPGYISGKVYIVVPEDFNRYNIIGWNEVDEETSEDNMEDGENETGTEEEVVAEVVVSGGYYKEDVPIRVLYSGSTQTVYGRGVPLRIQSAGNVDDTEEEFDIKSLPTYVWYFDEHYDEATETPETFSYPTYVDENGNPIVLTGVWRKLPEALKGSASPTVYGGGMLGTSDRYHSTYVEFNSGYLAAIYAGGKNTTKGTANLVLDADGLHEITNVYGSGNANTSYYTNKVNISVKNGTYNTIYAGGNLIITNHGTQVDITGGKVNNIYMGSAHKDGDTYGTVTLNLENCTVGNIYGGGYNSASLTVGPAYINVNDNVNITGKIYPMGSAKLNDDWTTGAVTIRAFVTLNDSDKAKVDQQFKKISYTKSQAPKIFVNGVRLGDAPEYTGATFEIAEKMVNVTVDASYSKGNNTTIFLNGIPTIVAGDGAGHSYLYQAKTKDGTLNVYQKNEDGTFKYDENGNRISNIVRDPVTGQAIKGAKLADRDVSDDHIFGGANGKSVEDTYIEFHQGGTVFNLYGGSLGGNTGYNAQGEEVGLVEVRMFGGSIYNVGHLANKRGKDVSGNSTVNTLCTRTVFIGINGTANTLTSGGDSGVLGSEEKYIAGYYNRAGETFTYEDADDGQIYEITGAWEEYNLDLDKSDYTEYYEATNAYFNGTGEADFVNMDYYVDPYDDHYTGYCLVGNFMPQNIYMGTSGTEYEISVNRVFGNQYLRHTAYGLKYDAQLDRFVEDYNNYKGFDAITIKDYAGSKTGAVYSDYRFDLEGVNIRTCVYPIGGEKYGVQHNGQVYINLYEEDAMFPRASYKLITLPDKNNVTIKENFYPRWSLTSAWALDVDEVMPQLAIDKRYITETSNPENVRTHMLSAENAAKLLNYYYTGTEEYITHANIQQTEGYQRIFDASDDVGKFTIRTLDPRTDEAMGIKRFTNFVAGRPGNCTLMTLPNGKIMLVDTPKSVSSAYIIREVRYYLESAKQAGIGDGKTIDYLVVTHFHTDHYQSVPALVETFDIVNAVLPPFDFENSVTRAINVKSEKYVREGKEPINIIKPMRDTKLTIGEGEEAVQMHFLNPGDSTQGTLTFENIKKRIERDGFDGDLGNNVSIAAKMTYKGQSFLWGGDMGQDPERTILRLYGEDYLDCDVLDLDHHGYAGNNITAWLNAADPQIVIQHLVTTGNPTISHKYCADNNTGGFAEEVYKDGRVGSYKIVLDGEKITADTQLRPRAYEKNTQEYINLESSYSEIVERINDTRNSLVVVADGATAPYGTAYIWSSYANYIDSQLEELSKRGFMANVTGDILEDYIVKLEQVEQFIEDATMYGGTDTTPDVEVPGTPGTDVGGNDTTTPGASGGIIGDIGGGDAGSGIGGGAAPGGAVVGPAGPSVDDGETTDPVTPDDNRRFIDVAETDWFNKAVNYVADNNYFQGVSENEFDPDGKMTRAMLVTVIGRIAKADVSQAKSDFADVEDGNWYAGYVAWAAENGIVTGVGEGKFAPNDNVTREQ
ncbi:MAG: S-layer homology domain-containing protein, partial [Clostridia bacterium]|nr:S-layer homology domain-containing protein [Clostridia bacterium]